MKIKKIFILFSMLAMGLSFKSVNNKDKMVVADAAEPETYAYLNKDWKSLVTSALSEQGVSDVALFKTLLITDKSDKVPSNYVGSPVDVDTDNSVTNVKAYVYPNTTDATKFDCVIYSDVDMVYAQTGYSLFAQLTNVEKITFDCNFSMAKTNVMFCMFEENENLVQIEGLANILDTDNVTNMSYMFSGCSSLTTLDVSSLNTSNATVMSHMFSSCSSLTTIDISNFNTSNVTDMSGMFGWCGNLSTIKGLDSGKFITSKVTDMSWMFYNDRKLTSVDLSHFNTSQVKRMDYMFGWCESLTTLDVSNFDTTNVTDMSAMFSACSGLTTLDVSNFNTSNVREMDDMFGFNKKLTTLKGLENFDTSNVTDMNRMFIRCEALKEINISNFNTSKVTNMESMFSGCCSVSTLDLSSFDTSNVTNMTWMFSSCENLSSIKGLEKFNTSKVTNMEYMFSHCSNVSTLDLSSFDTSNVTNMSWMFSYCNNLTNIKGLENFNTANVTNMGYMFYKNNKLTTLDLSSFDLRNVTNIENFLYGTSYLEKVILPKDLNNNTFQLPVEFGMTEIDPTMAGWTLLEGSKEFNILYNTLLTIDVCAEYEKAPELQAMYDGLSNEEKEKLATLSDKSDVVLSDKLSYMVGYADYKANEATTTSGTHLVLSTETSQYLVVAIACLSLSLISGYYFIQKRKYSE